MTIGNIDALERAAQAYYHAARTEKEMQEYIRGMMGLGIEQAAVMESAVYKQYLMSLTCWRMLADRYREEAQVQGDGWPGPGTPDATTTSVS